MNYESRRVPWWEPFAAFPLISMDPEDIPDAYITAGPVGSLCQRFVLVALGAEGPICAWVLRRLMLVMP